MGQDKATLRLAGTTLARRVADLLRATVSGPCLEVGPGHSGLAALAEDPPGRGPLAATAAGLVALRAQGPATGCLVLATDLPALTASLLAFLASTADPATSVVPLLDGYPQYLCARWSTDAQDCARRLVADGERSVRAVFAACPPLLVPEATWAAAAGRPDAAADVDLPEQWATFTQGHSQSPAEGVIR
jgi:molybdopterin-guanine dinucleotide biosynthesis protein A